MTELIISREELKERQALPLKDKLDLTVERIEKWYDYWKGNIYVAFSGGKDSTALLHIVRSLFPEVPAVFNDTGLEYPEIKDYVKTYDNVVITKPKLTYRQVIEKYGFPVVSKEQSRFIYEYQTTNSQKLRDIRLLGNKWGMGKISNKWKFLLDAPFKISHKCCDILKKNPSKVYERKTGRRGMVGSTTEESMMRTSTYLRFGCNAYGTTRPLSMPLAFWKEQDILRFLKDRDIKLSSIYGDIVEAENGELKTTGVDRSGCVWCMFGVNQEKFPNRFQKLKISHPKIYNYCINNLGLGDVLDFMEVTYA